MPCAVPLSEVVCVTILDIEPLRVCFSTELVVFRVRPSCLTGSITKSIPFAVKEPSKDRSGDGGLIYCCAAITSGSVKNAEFDRTSESNIVGTLTDTAYSPTIPMEPMM